MAAFQGWRRWVCGAAVLAGSLSSATAQLLAQVVPGTGTLANTDDLENPQWAYVHNGPKSSKEEDEQIRYPLGAANNNKWFESPKRGSPDVVKRVDTPPGGLAGSTGALYLRTRDSGIPGHPGGKQAQDDFILAAKPLSVGYQPNYTVRVFLPEWDQWEQRNGVTFGIRAGMQGPMTKDKEVSFGKRFLKGKRTEKVTEMEPYYPGFFIQFNPKSMPGNKEGDHALILLRSDGLGHEVPGPKITQTGWWTFGMSVSADARCHFYASPGVDELTPQDHIYSSLPYGIRGEVFNTVFFNVCSADNGQTWSTPWIIDDPKVYYVDPRNPAKGPVAQQPAPLQTAANPNPVAAPAAQPIQPPPAAPQTPAAPAATTPAAPAAVPQVPAAQAQVQAAQPQVQVAQPAAQQPAVPAQQVPARGPAVAQPQARPAQVPAATQQPQVRAAQVPAAQPQVRAAQVPMAQQPQARVAQVPAATQQPQARTAQLPAPQQRPAAILQVPAAQAASIPMTTTPVQVPAPQTPVPQVTAQTPQPIPAPASARPILVAPQPAAVATPAPVAAVPAPALAPAEAAAPATTKAIPMPQGPLLIPGTPAPAPAPVAVTPAPAPAAPALPAVPMTAQLPAELAPKATVAPPKTPNPKVISADDFFAPPPRAPLAPVNPSTQPPAPPPVE